MPLGHVVAAMVRHRGRESNRTGYLLERAQRDATQAILLINDFTLLSYAQATVHRARRCTKHGNVCFAAATADRSAATMEQCELNILGNRGVGKGYLSVLQRPTRRSQAAILVAVRIADHDHLSIFTARKVLAIQVDGKQRLHDFRPAREIVDRLEQWRDVEWHVAASIVQLAPLREQQNGQNIVCSLGHADDKRANRSGAVLATTRRDRLKYADRLACNRAYRIRHALAALNGIGNSGGPIFGRPAIPIFFTEALTDNTAMNLCVLPNIQRNEVKPKGCDAPNQAVERKQARMLALMGLETVSDERDVRQKLLGFFVRKYIVIVG